MSSESPQKLITNMYCNFLKRLLDFVAAFFLLIICSPLFVFIAICIKLESKGTVFFRQQRAGKNGKNFTLLKFRTMSADTNSERKDFEPGTKNRITRIGKILRKSKLDELPQLINVLKGEMSLVGPRPEVRAYIELYPEKWEVIHKVRPGITDPASIKFRNEEELLSKADDPEKQYREVILPQKLALYEEYVKNISFLQDVKIILGTIFTVLFK